MSWSFEKTCSARDQRYNSGNSALMGLSPSYARKRNRGSLGGNLKLEGVIIDPVDILNRSHYYMTRGYKQ